MAGSVTKGPRISSWIPTSVHNLRGDIISKAFHRVNRVILAHVSCLVLFLRYYAGQFCIYHKNFYIVLTCCHTTLCNLIFLQLPPYCIRIHVINLCYEILQNLTTLLRQRLYLHPFQRYDEAPNFPSSVTTEIRTNPDTDTNVSSQHTLEVPVT